MKFETHFVGRTVLFLAKFCSLTSFQRSEALYLSEFSCTIGISIAFGLFCILNCFIAPSSFHITQLSATSLVSVKVVRDLLFLLDLENFEKLADLTWLKLEIFQLLPFCNIGQYYKELLEYAKFSWNLCFAVLSQRHELN